MGVGHSQLSATSGCVSHSELLPSSASEGPGEGVTSQLIVVSTGAPSCDMGLQVHRSVASFKRLNHLNGCFMLASLELRCLLPGDGFPLDRVRSLPPDTNSPSLNDEHLSCMYASTQVVGLRP